MRKAYRNTQYKVLATVSVCFDRIYSNRISKRVHAHIKPNGHALVLISSLLLTLISTNCNSNSLEYGNIITCMCIDVLVGCLKTLFFSRFDLNLEKSVNIFVRRKLFLATETHMKVLDHNLDSKEFKCTFTSLYPFGVFSFHTLHVMPQNVNMNTSK